MPLIPRRSRILLPAARAFLALFVARGSIAVMTRAWVLPFQAPVKEYWPEMRDCKYTLVLVTFTQRGWPLNFYVKTGLPERTSSFREGIRPAALSFDVVVAGVLIVAAWNLLGTCRLQFSLADMFTFTTSVALTLSFHLVAWGRQVELSRFAVDVGAFCTAFTTIREARKLPTRLSRWRSRRLERLP